ncbi:DinB family protein [Aridibaculum aurantiacum]|uniref:DinB family protein n=1 Tax=Aridibaculum aurantiacum TaxID=2810307 RepID=UPI001A97B4EF|nr:DinB family protein [Aridibaculum aurantiacum]
MPRPATGTFPAYYANYISLVQVDDVPAAIETYSKDILTFWRNIPVEKHTHRYAEGKWDLKEMLQHVIDTERIFAYRALRLARKDTTPLPGFDEVAYAANSKASDRPWDDLLAEFECTRQSTNLLLLSFDEEQLQQQGFANDNPVTVHAICFIIYGHLLHHQNIISERYL